MRWDAGRDLADLADLAGVRAATLQPHRQEKWKLSADPQFVAKVKAIVGLYLNPPERAVVVPWHITAGLFGRVRILACQTSLMRSRLTAVALAAGLAGLYYARLRRPVLTWGSTEAEAASRLPRDELLEDADAVTTRAIMIDAPAADVWPWLTQMGPAPRGGAYTYDWIENLLGLNMHSAERVLPAFQHPEVGDTLAARVGVVPMEAGSLVTERKMLRGIKQRAERLASVTPEHFGGQIA